MPAAPYRVVGIGTHVGDDRASNVSEIRVCIGLLSDADEHRPLALALDAHRADQLVDHPLRHLSADIEGLRHERIRARVEIFAGRHEEAVRVALRLVDDDPSDPACEQAKGDQRQDAAGDDGDDPAGRPLRAGSAASGTGLGNGRRLEEPRRRATSAPPWSSRKGG